MASKIALSNLSKEEKIQRVKDRRKFLALKRKRIKHERYLRLQKALDENSNKRNKRQGIIL